MTALCKNIFGEIFLSVQKKKIPFKKGSENAFLRKSPKYGGKADKRKNGLMYKMQMNHNILCLSSKIIAIFCNFSY